MNIKKSQVVHHPNHQRPRCQMPLYLMGGELEYVQDYKYLGCWINKVGNNDKTVQALTTAASRSYGRIVRLFRELGDMGYRSFCSLYNSYVLPVACYGVAVWGFKDYSAPQVLQNKILHFYLGVHRFASVAVTHLEMNILCIQFACWLEQIRYYNRIVKLNSDRLPKKILMWEITNGIKGWFGEVEDIVKVLHLPPPDGEFEYDLQAVEDALFALERKRWFEDVDEMSKLRHYCGFTNREEFGAPARGNLKCFNRSLLAKLYCGILPLQVEVGRYTRQKRELRH